MKNEITAIFVVALIAFGGVGVSVASPADLVGYDTPQERLVAYQGELDNMIDHLEANSVENGGYVTSRIMYSYTMSYYEYYQNLLNDYLDFYNFIEAA
jgi:hypothetical protein